LLRVKEKNMKRVKDFNEEKKQEESDKEKGKLLKLKG
jgi:hypothetical protein